MPMLYEGRQHRRSSRESLDCAMALQDLERMGVSNIITFDAQILACKTRFPPVVLESVMPSYQIFKALLKRDKTLQIDKEHMMIVSPDEGAIDRNIFYSSVLGLDMGLFYKRRDYTRNVNGRNPIVAMSTWVTPWRERISLWPTISSLRRIRHRPGPGAEKAQG